MDVLGYQHNERTKQIADKLNTTARLQPYDVLVFGAAKQKLLYQHKLDRQSDIQPTLQCTFEQFSALHSWDRIRTTYTPEQLRHKSSSSSLKRAKSLFTGHNS